jgi:hypothetical protein
MTTLISTLGYTPGQLLKVIVKAENAEGLSDFNEISSGINAESVPLAPSGLTGNALTDTSIELNWTPISQVPTT